MKRKLGWVRDTHDSRDYQFTAKISHDKVPQAQDLRGTCPVVVDQGNLGSCVGNSVAGMLQIQQLKQGKVYYDPKKGRTLPLTSYTFAPSRLFIYYGARELENAVNDDAGCQIRDAIKFVAANGVCSSTRWPYHIGKFADKPSEAAYAEAKARGNLLAYHRLNNNHLSDLLSCLAQGEPFVFGFSVYSNFMSDEVATTGIVGMPSQSDQFEGGHAVCAVGYDQSTKRFLVRNSWGKNWGLGGYFWMPFAYVTDPSLSNDFWTVTLVE